MCFDLSRFHRGVQLYGRFPASAITRSSVFTSVRISSLASRLSVSFMQLRRRFRARMRGFRSGLGAVAAVMAVVGEMVNPDTLPPLVAVGSGMVVMGDGLRFQGVGDALKSEGTSLTLKFER